MHAPNELRERIGRADSLGRQNPRPLASERTDVISGG